MKRIVRNPKEEPGIAEIGAALLAVFLLTVVAPSPVGAMTYGNVTYSDATVDSYGIIRGWGVTDARSSGCYCHTAKISTTIRSPNGRTQTASDMYGGRGHEYARADVSLAFLTTDEGNYTTTSTHWAFCPYCNCYFVNGCQTVDFIDIGHSVNWLKFDKYDEEHNYCVYKQNVGCSPSCPATINYASPPCSNGQDNKAYQELWMYYWRSQSSGTRYCFPIGLEKSYAAVPGTCRDVD